MPSFRKFASLPVTLRLAFQLFSLTIAIAIGCSSPKNEIIEIQPPTALTITDWATLPVEEKYAPETFERLKIGDPKLNDEENWDKFMREVIVPARKIDIPM